jgi:hypothetical protein
LENAFSNITRGLFYFPAWRLDWFVTFVIVRFPFAQHTARRAAPITQASKSSSAGAAELNVADRQ